MMGIVDASILTRMLAPAALQQQQAQQAQQQHASSVALQSSQLSNMSLGFGAAAYPPPARPVLPVQPAASYAAPIPQAASYGMVQQAAPPPAPTAPAPLQQAPLSAAAQQTQLIQQVLSLTPQQIDALAPEHRNTILQIVRIPINSLIEMFLFGSPNLISWIVLICDLFKQTFTFQ